MHRTHRIAPMLLLAAAAVALSAPLAAQSKPGNLQAVISQMNAASAKFTSAQADLRQEIFTKAVQDTETQTGQIYFVHKGTSTQMGMKMLPSDAKPGAPPSQIVEFKDGKLRMLNTGTSQIDEFSTSGKNQSTAETLMTLGFGGSGSDLEKSWTITDQGSDQIDNVKVERLDLVSKDASIRNNFSQLTIWVDPVRDVSLKQLFYLASNGKPTGDTRTVVFSNIRLNQNVNTAPFALKCPNKCTTLTH